MLTRVACCCLQVNAKHHYGTVLPMKVSVTFSGSSELRILACTFRYADTHANRGLVTVDLAGKIIYANRAFETALHLTAGQSNLCADLMAVTVSVHSDQIVVSDICSLLI
jgi:hypothetical protein